MFNFISQFLLRKYFHIEMKNDFLNVTFSHDNDRHSTWWFWSMHSSSFMGCTLNCIFVSSSFVFVFFFKFIFLEFQCYPTPAFVHRVLLFKHTGVGKGKKWRWFTRVAHVSLLRICSNTHLCSGAFSRNLLHLSPNNVTRGNNLIPSSLARLCFIP